MKNTSRQTTSELKLFDTHCHLDFEVFAGSFDDEVKQAFAQGVKRIVIPSIGASNWLRVQTLAAQYPETIYYALGFHPYFLHTEVATQLSSLEKQLSESSSSCVAVGECGLDGAIDIDALLQEKMLIAQISLASDAKLPVILHSRKTHNRLLQILQQTHFKQGGVLHAFSGSEQQARQFIDLGFKIGVGGVITYPRANKTRIAISRLPIESLVLETDAPDMPMFGLQGEINHPKYLLRILDTLVELRQSDKAVLASQLWANSEALFGLNRLN